MQRKTILNRVTQFKSFVFEKVTWLEDATIPTIEVEILPSAERPSDRLRLRSNLSWRRHHARTTTIFVPLWGIAMSFVYQMRRVQCPGCGIKVERVPWAEGKSSMTTELKWFLARWARQMSWKEVSLTFRVSWDRVFEAVKHAVFWGLEHRSLDEIEAIGVDEVPWHRGTSIKRWSTNGRNPANGCWG